MSVLGRIPGLGAKVSGQACDDFGRTGGKPHFAAAAVVRILHQRIARAHDAGFGSASADVEHAFGLADREAAEDRRGCYLFRGGRFKTFGRVCEKLSRDRFGGHSGNALQKGLHGVGEKARLGNVG